MTCSRRARIVRRPLAVELLDRRDLLAGDVTASVVGNDLVITGDAAANGVYVSNLGGDLVEVRGMDLGGAATTINGSASFSHQFTAPGDVLVDLAGGNDRLGIGDIASLPFIDTSFPNINTINPLAGELTVDIFPQEMSLPSGLEVDLGDGDDLALIKAFAPNGVEIEGGSDAGDDFVLYRDATTPSGTSADFTLHLGDGDNNAGLYLNTPTGATTITSGSGEDKVVAVVNTVCDLSIDGGGDDDELDFHTPVLGDGARPTQITIVGGDGDDSIGGGDFGAATLNIDAGDGNNHIYLEGPKIAGNANLTAGSGTDRLDVRDGISNGRPFENITGLPSEFITGYIGGNLSIDLGDGNQGPGPGGAGYYVHLGATMRGQTGSFVVAGDLNYAGGTGIDTVNIQAAFLLGDVNVETGDGQNEFNLRVAQVVGDVRVNGGSGGDTLYASACYVHGSLRMNGAGSDDILWIDNEDYLSLSSVITGLVLLDGGDGNDLLQTNSIWSWGRRLYASTGVIVHGGAGNDTIRLNALTTPFAIAHGGAGNDELVQLYHSSQFVLLDGGDATDEFTFDPFVFGPGHYTGIDSLQLVDMEVDVTGDYD